MTGPAPTDRRLMAAYPGTEVTAEVRRSLRDHRPAGVTVFLHHNVDTPDRLRAWSDELQASRATETPLLLAADQEGGQFLALGAGSTPFAGNLALAATRDLELAERVGAAIGTEVKACGIDVIYAPVADVACNRDNPALGIRSAGDDPQLVASVTAALVRGIRSAGVAATLKHFPGKGDVAVDTHHALGVIPHGRERLDRVELAPFRAGIEAGAQVVMSAHAALPAVTGADDLPATLSRAVMTDLLRAELGFTGVTITDALDMHALAQGGGQLVDAIAALRAGVDLLLCGPDQGDQQRLRDGLALALRRGLLDAGALATSERRVRALAAWASAHPRPDVDVVGGAAHRALAHELAAAAVTAVHDRTTVVPLRPDARILAVMPRPRDLSPADTSSQQPAALAPALRGHFATVDELVTGHPPSDADVAEARRRAGEADAVVLGTIAATRDGAQLALGDALVATGVPVVHVALRTPHDLTAVPGTAARYATYSLLRPSLDAFAAVLAGEATAPGRLPVELGAPAEPVA